MVMVMLLAEGALLWFPSSAASLGGQKPPYQSCFAWNLQELGRHPPNPPEDLRLEITWPAQKTCIRTQLEGSEALLGLSQPVWTDLFMDAWREGHVGCLCHFLGIQHISSFVPDQPRTQREQGAG